MANNDAANRYKSALKAWHEHTEARANVKPLYPAFGLTQAEAEQAEREINAVLKRRYKHEGSGKGPDGGI